MSPDHGAEDRPAGHLQVGRAVPRPASRTGIPNAWMAAAVFTGLAVGLAVGLAAARHRPVPTFASAVGVDDLAGGGARRAYAVVGAEDCAGLAVALSGAVGAARAAGAELRVVVPGNAGDADSVRRTLAASGLVPPVILGASSLPRAVRALGHRTTPLLVVLDGAGAVHLATPFPTDPEGLHRWHTLLPVALAR